MRLRINGNEEETKALNIAELVNELSLTERSVVVEHNGEIIPHEQWTVSALKEGDVLELLNFVGGG